MMPLEVFDMYLVVLDMFSEYLNKFGQCSVKLSPPYLMQGFLLELNVHCHMNAHVPLYLYFILSAFLYEWILNAKLSPVALLVVFTLANKLAFGFVHLHIVGFICTRCLNTSTCHIFVHIQLH